MLSKSTLTEDRVDFSTGGFQMRASMQHTQWVPRSAPPKKKLRVLDPQCARNHCLVQHAPVLEELPLSYFGSQLKL